MIVFNLVATGRFRNMEGRGWILSRKGFTTKKGAEDYAAEFLIRCQHSEGPSSLRDLDDQAIVDIISVEVPVEGYD